MPNKAFVIKEAHHCKSCRKELPYSQFFLRPDGYPWRRKCRGCICIAQKEARKTEGYAPLARGEKDRANARKWRRDNPERAEAASRRWKERNSKHVALKARVRTRAYQLGKQKRVPLWLTDCHKRWIEAIYEVASELNLEVDHAVPLHGETVSGLHVPWNMQLLSRSRNAAKLNRI